LSNTWQAQQQPSGLLVRASFFPLAFLLYFFPPKMSIDGSAPIDLRWGDNPLPGVPPGTHQVRVWFRYLIFGDCGVAQAVIQVPPGGMFLEYKAPTWFVFSKGTFPSLPVAAQQPQHWQPQHQHQQHAQPQPQQAAAASAGGGWHPDPLGRAEQRYWDGRTWTGHVVRNGQQAWDELTPQAGAQG
jgi:hypothetical protein